jgi:hypothetical protein
MLAHYFHAKQSDKSYEDILLDMEKQRIITVNIRFLPSFIESQ